MAFFVSERVIEKPCFIKTEVETASV
ncbi:hypothetical protein FB444_101103 [Vibrio crassostreae]|nr:hypothetical protein EDB45_106174 [Vibrio crassostreae]TWD71198.1 hypothetical protein FB444_101103 [Vibrio crassostreae]